MLVIATGVAVAGCALRDPRSDYAYSRASEGLWGDRPFELIDWNFPTSVNQGPIEAPERIRLDRTAIGVTWATRNPLPLSESVEYEHTPILVKSNDAAAGKRAANPARGGAAGDPARGGEQRSAR
ncbi:MAG: hypothetical protein ACM3JC_06320 [Rudaea sp.]